MGHIDGPCVTVNTLIERKQPQAEVNHYLIVEYQNSAKYVR